MTYTICMSCIFKNIMSTWPNKKSDSVLYALLESKIRAGNYVFLKHAKERQKERFISDLDVLNILEGKKFRDRTRNYVKDQYKDGYQDWNYCIEGVNMDKDKIRIIISFLDDLMPIITVIRL